MDGLQGRKSSGGGDGSDSGGTGHGWLVMRVATCDHGGNPTTTASAFVWVSGTTTAAALLRRARSRRRNL